jgi:nucleoside-diphosphate-sugar epimerase
MLADFVTVHLAAIASLMGTLSFHALVNSAISRAFIIDTLRRDYLDQFVLLSISFPCVFLLCGFYTRSRGYAARYKWLVILRGCLLGSLVYLFGSVLITRSGILPRSSLLLLPILVTAGVIGTRYFNFWTELRQLRSVPAAAREPQPEDCPVLVVGGAGYIGAVILRKLLARGYKVRLLDNLAYGDKAIRDVLADPRVEFIRGDCRNIQDVVKAMANVRSVIHLAAIVGDPACAADDKNAREINYAATRMMLEIAKGYGIRRLIFASSCSVYGATDHLMDEQSQTVPVSLYGETKLNSEKVLLDAVSADFHPVVLRLATVFGLAPRPRFDLVVNLLTAKAFSEGVITIFNGEQWRPFIHVNDVAEAFCSVLEAPSASVSGEIFNVGDDRFNYTLNQVAEMIQRQLPGTTVERTENADKRNYRVSFRKIRQRIGFQCTATLEDGIREIRVAFESGALTTYRDPYYSNVNYLKAHGGVNAENEIDMRVMAAFASSLNAIQAGSVASPVSPTAR